MSLLHLMKQVGRFPFAPGSHGIYVPGKFRKRAGQWLRRWFDKKKGQCCLYFFCYNIFETNLQKTDSRKKQTIEIFHFSLKIHVRENRSGVRAFTSPLLAAHLRPSKPITNGQVLGAGSIWEV